MTKTDFMTGVSRTFNKIGFTLKKHSPEILLGAGIVGAVASAVMACKATTKLSEVMEKSKQDIADIHHVMDNINSLPAGVEYTLEDGKKDLAITYAKTGVELVKLYAPSVILGALSITSICASHGIMHKRNVALAAAYTAVDTGFKEYRKRVVDRFGQELDKELKFNLKSKEVEEQVVDENGKVKTEKKVIQTTDNHLGNSPYAIVFDETCEGWVKDAELNKFFLHQVERWANERLQARGHLFLNEVYDELGAQRTKAGNTVGWIYDEKNPIGDNYVSFGIYDDIHNERKAAFINGYERSIIIDFNVDGDILSLLP